MTMRARTGVAAALACVALAGCSTAVSGRPVDAPARSGDVAPPLTSLLETAPAGSKPWATTWADNETPSVTDFVARVYAPADETAEAARLQSEGIVAIAHRAWVAPAARQADVVLLRFATAAGANLRMRTAVAP